MAAEIEPQALADLVDFSERPRVHDWSLRSAFVRYAQPEPQRVNDILDVVRRTEWGLGQHSAELSHDGQALWNALDGDASTARDSNVVGLLDVARELDDLGDVLATWAVDRATSPDAEVDRVVADVARRLEALGVPHQERPPGPRNRG